MIEETMCDVGENEPWTREGLRVWWILKLEE